MSQITISQFFAGYMAAGMEPQTFDQLTPEQQLQAQFDFIGVRATYILDLDFDAPEAPPRNIAGEARRILRDLINALTAIERGDIYATAMLSVSIGRWMERVTSGQLAGKAITITVNNEELAAAKAKYSQTQRVKGRLRWSNDEANQEINRIVEALADSLDAIGDPTTPLELWPLLCSQMDDKGMRPVERDNAITCEGITKPYTYDAFRKKLARTRAGT